MHIYAKKRQNCNAFSQKQSLLVHSTDTDELISYLQHDVCLTGKMKIHPNNREKKERDFIGQFPIRSQFSTLVKWLTQAFCLNMKVCWAQIFKDRLTVL